MSSVREALTRARQRLAGLPDNDPDLDARVLLCHTLGKPPTWLFAWPDTELTPVQQASFDALLEQRAMGVPVAHLTGHREFWGLELKVSPATLIPRPDTELLVETALTLGADKPGIRLLDLGTGSGAIALAIAHERPGWQITATDSSDAALELAQENAAALGLQWVRLLPGHWFEAVGDECFDLIVSNPPYIRSNDPHLDQGDVVHEPRSALTAGHDGLDDLRLIVAGASKHLVAGGWLAVEHGWDQGEAARQLLRDAGFEQVTTRQDLAGHDRVSLGCLPQTPE